MKKLKRQMIFCFIIWGLIGVNIANLVHFFIDGAPAVLIVLDVILVGLGIAIGIYEIAIVFVDAEIMELQAKADVLKAIIDEVEREEAQE